LPGAGRYQPQFRQDASDGAGQALRPRLLLLNVITGDLALDTHEARMLAVTSAGFAPPVRFERYTRCIRALAPPSAREPLETLMKTVLKDSFVDGLLNQGRAEGRTEGRTELLLRLLGKRFGVPESIRGRVETCTDTAQINIWFDRAITATSLDEVFTELRR
jgi:hypothetical protein